MEPQSERDSEQILTELHEHLIEIDASGPRLRDWRRFRLRVEFIDLLPVALFDHAAAEFQVGVRTPLSAVNSSATSMTRFSFSKRARFALTPSTMPS